MKTSVFGDFSHSLVVNKKDSQSHVGQSNMLKLNRLTFLSDADLDNKLKPCTLIKENIKMIKKFKPSL